MLFYYHDTSDDELFDNCAKNYEWIISTIELERERTIIARGERKRKGIQTRVSERASAGEENKC